MTALADHHPLCMFSPFLGLWVAWGQGYMATGDHHHEACELWEIIYKTMEEL
jgi:hypothetical protein